MRQRECKFLRPAKSHQLTLYSIYLVHEDAKEKEFELEMSWIGDETNGLLVPVPKDLHDEADKKAKEAVEVE